MSLTLNCPHCATDFPVAEDDRGFTAYCVSCGRECDVPADLGAEATAKEDSATSAPPEADNGEQRSDVPASAAQEIRKRPSPGDRAGNEPSSPLSSPQTHDSDTEPRPSVIAASERSSDSDRRKGRVSVFSAVGATQVLEKTIDEIDCLCGEKIPVTVEDVGTTVYCPACGAGLPVGEKLQKVAVARATQHVEDDESPSVPVSHPVFRWMGSRAGVATMFVVAAALALGVYITWQHPEMLPEGVREVLAVGTPSTPPPSPNSAEDEQDEDLPDPDEPITLEAINALLNRDDPRNALYQAQLWDGELEANEVPETEKRRVRLQEVMKILLDRMTPKPKPPPKYVLTFRKLLKQLGEALNQEDVKLSRRLYDEADALFNKHPDELAEESRLLVLYRQQLQRLELKVGGVKKVEDLLLKAADLAVNDHPTLALELQTRAFLMARQLPDVSEDDGQRLIRLNKERVKPVIAWSRGKRAVADAEACLNQRDRRALDQQLNEIALKFLPATGSELPGVPDTGAKRLNRRARALAERRISRPRSTTLGRMLDVRLQYERALDHLGHGRSVKFSAAAAEVYRDFQSLQGNGQLYDDLSQLIKRMPQLAFDMISQKLAGLDDLPPSEHPARLAALRTALNHLRPWKSLPRWKAIDGALRKSSRQLFADRLAHATMLAQQGRYREAIEAAKALENIGDDDTAAEARKNRVEWERQLKLQTARKNRDSHLKRIAQLLDDNKVLDAGREAHRFEQRYPDSTDSDDYRALQSRMDGPLQARVNSLLDEAQQQRKAKEWDKLRRTLSRLQGVPLSSSRKNLYDALQKTLESQEDRIKALMLRIRRVERMATNDEIISVRKLTAELLKLDPGHAEAKRLHERSTKLAATTAARLLRQAEVYVKYVKRGRRDLKQKTLTRLNDIIKLNPDGPYGLKAKRYKAEISRR